MSYLNYIVSDLKILKNLEKSFFHSHYSAHKYGISENSKNVGKYIVTDKNGNRLDKEEDNFDLYINISKNAKNSLPRDIIVNKFFHEYRIKKKQFPKSTYYSV